MLVALLYTAGIVVWHLLDYTPLAGWWPYRLVSLVDIWFFLPLPLLLLYAWFRRRLRTVVVLCLPLLLFTYEYGDLFLPTARAESEQSLRVMTANLLSANEETQALGATVIDQRPDVLAVQELTPRLARSLEAQIGREYPYKALYPKGAYPDLGIYSRFPLRGVVAERSRAGDCPCQQATVDLPDGSITVLNVHPGRPNMNFRRIGGLPLPTSYDTRERDRELRAILERAREIDGPLVVLGDFNLSDQDRSYRLLDQTLNDAYRAAGWGLGYTFPTATLDETLLGRGVARLPYFPLVRIDYVFHSDHLTSNTARVVGLPGSDHLAVVADLRLEADTVTRR